MTIKKSFLIMFVFFLLTGPGFAHMPQSVGLTYDPLTEMISTDITHTTTNAAVHYVYKIDVLVNGKQVISDDTIGGQPNNTGRTYTARLRNIRTGDTIQVIAYCNRRGQRSATITATSGGTRAGTKANTKTETPAKEIQPEKTKNWWE